MKKTKKFYITTTLPYVNAEPHIGFAAEIIKADAIARYRAQKGDEVFFNTGTDEHGLKIYRKALEKGVDPKAYCDEYAAKFGRLKEALNLSYNSFTRTTDPKHVAAAQEFWRRCAAKGDIEKKIYKVKYCVGCELEKTESELAGGRCPLHPGQDLEEIEEENYFFKWSRYQEKLLDFYQKNPEFVLPEHRFKEIKNFVKAGLKDFSISRLKAKMPWGVPVPGDNEQVMYVWFDALVSYISALGWPASAEAPAGWPALDKTADNSALDKDATGRRALPGDVADKLALIKSPAEKSAPDETKEKINFFDWWPGTQVAGKDNLRQQSAMWQAMLMSAGLPASKQILIFGFITSDGQKMSKSLGNVINPHEVVEKYGSDALRYFLLSEIAAFSDGDFSREKFETRYNADLANGLGNLVGRTAALLEKNGLEVDLIQASDAKLQKEFDFLMAEYHFDEALKLIWKKIAESDGWLTEKAPWKMKEKNEIMEALKPVAESIFLIGNLLRPFLPAAAEKIISQFGEKQIKKQDALFPRI